MTDWERQETTYVALNNQHVCGVVILLIHNEIRVLISRP